MYRIDDEVPNDGVFPEAVAVPSIDSKPFITSPEGKAFVPLPDKVMFV